MYCITGRFNLNGNAKLSEATGRVRLVLQDQHITLNSSAANEFDDLEIDSRNATFALNGGVIFRANRLRFFLTGNGNMIVNVNSELTSGDAHFYLRPGHITWNSGSNIHLTGTFLVLRSPATFNGGVDFERHSQIIGYDSIINGNADVDTFFVASENYQVPNVSSPTIEFTK